MIQGANRRKKGCLFLRCKQPPLTNAFLLTISERLHHAECVTNSRLTMFRFLVHVDVELCKLISIFSSGVPGMMTSACAGCSIMLESSITSSLSGSAASCRLTSARISSSKGSSRSAFPLSLIHCLFVVHLQVSLDGSLCLPISHPLYQICSLLYFCCDLLVF